MKSSSSAIFEVGFAKRKITPKNPEGVYLAGFAPERLSIGLRDDLYARAISIRRGESEYNLVVLDLIGLMLPYVEKIRARLSPVARSNTTVACTHTHSGPDTLGLWGRALLGALPVESGIDSDYMEFVVEQAANAIVDAASNRKRARLFHHTAMLPYPNLIENIRERGNFDKRLGVLAVREAKGGNLLGMVLNFACHPELLWEKNRYVSADFVGDLCGRLEQESSAFVMFTNAALGGMVTPDIDELASTADREIFLRHFVDAIGNTAWKALFSDGVALEGELFTLRRRVLVPADNLQFRLMRHIKVLSREIRNGAFETEVSLSSIGGLFVAALPGEPLPAVGYEVLARIGAESSWLIGLANDELGYLLPRPYFDLPLYRYERSVSPGPDTTPALMEALHLLIRAARS